MRYRVALVLTLLMGISSVSAFLENDLGFNSDQYQAQEVFLVSLIDEQVSHEIWVEMEDKGLVILRSPDPNQLVVWASHDLLFQSLENMSFAFEYESQKTMLTPQVSQHTSNEYRMVLEPNLPNSAMKSIVSKLSYLGEIKSGLGSDSLFGYSIEINLHQQIGMDFSIPGVMWVEPVLKTDSRNIQAAGLIQNGQTSERSLWDLGINGQGVIIGVADSGFDHDHSCFLDNSSVENNSVNTSQFGSSHRKIESVNFSIDDGDYIGDSDYGHGTHIAGILGCKVLQDENSPTGPVSVATSASYGSRLIFQDIVNESGWVPPDIDLLLSESALNGGYIHSNSWGDATTDYTERSALIDVWAREFPWTITFVAPGNNAGTLLEPANARNAIAVGASEKSSESSRWMSSSHGPDSSGRNGIFVLAPGVGIYSAGADGQLDSFNDNTRRMSGTSMSTPMAASATALISQMVQDGWISGSNESRSMVNLSDSSPDWGDNRSLVISLSEGFTPSGPALKSLLALSADRIEIEPNENQTPNQILPRNPFDGWGQPNLENLLNQNMISNNSDPSRNLWLMDSYRLYSGEPKDLLAQRLTNSTSNLSDSVWETSGMTGPFLATGDIHSKRFLLQPGMDFEAFLSWPSRPEYIADDDLVLVAKLENGKMAISNDFNSTGYSDLYNPSFFDYDNQSSFPKDGENTHAIILNSESLNQSTWIELSVIARHVAINGAQSGLGVNGNQVGVGLAVKGIIKDPSIWQDDDGDEVLNENDLCPDISPLNDENNDGCIDDNDNDGVLDDFDYCIDETETGINPVWGVDHLGCAIVNNAPEAEFVTGPFDGQIVSENFITSFRLFDSDGDSVVANLEVLNSQNNLLYACSDNNGTNILHTCLIEIDNFGPFFINSNESLRLRISANDLNQTGSESAVVVYENNFYLGARTSNQNDPELPVIEVEGDTNTTRLFLLGILLLIAPTILLRSMKTRKKSEVVNTAIPAPFASDFRSQNITQHRFEQE